MTIRTPKHKTTTVSRAAARCFSPHGLLLVLAVCVVCVMTPGAALAQTFAWFQRPISGPSQRSDPGMAYDSARGVTVLFGGWMGSGPTATNSAETWEWNGTTWTQRLVSGPSARSSHAMAYDSARGVTVLYGGTPSGGSETWEWNGTTWTQRVVSGPGHRYNISMAYDSARGVCVLFGGFDGGSFVGDTWEWNGTSWTQRLVSGPSPRNGHGMAYDSARGVTVLFGGFNNGVGNAETWEWNGTTWTQRMVSGPSARTGVMAYDSARGVTVLFGGLTINGNVNAETWEWNGNGAGSWTQRVVSGPWARQLQAMAYDSARHATVMFGGNNWFAHFADTWEWANCIFASIATHPAPQTTCFSGTAAFTVAAGGTGPFSYQWQKKNPIFFNVYNDISNGPTGNGGSYSGTQTPTLTISGVSPNDPGEYRCIVTNNCGSATSNDASLDVPAESITFQPAPQTTCLFGTAAFTVTASPPSGTFTYQWQKKNPVFFNVYNDIFNGPTGNGGAYSGTQTSTLTISNVSPNDLGDYRCVITGLCQSIISNDASLAEPPPPVVTSGPTVTPGCAFGGGSMSITAATPPGSTYQWQRYVGPCVLCYVDVSDGPTGNGGTLSGAQSPSLSITGLNQTETFTQYRCIVTSACSNTPLAASPDAFFELVGLPLASAPAAPEVCPGGTVSISVNTTNVTSFQWEYYSSPLSVWVLIGDGPLVDFPAGFSATVTGSATDTLTLSSTFLGYPTPIRFSGGNICQIMAPIQTVLNYPLPPGITSQPATTNYCHGQPSSFTVGATSQLPLTYQWQLYHTALQQWINLVDGFYVGGVTGLSGTIAGSLTPTLTFTIATVGTVAPDQPFRCVVSHGCGSTTSQPANLHICISDVNCDGVITSQDFFDFITAFFTNSLLADVNTNGQVTSQDYFDFLVAFFGGC